jgi:leucyl/phenylalanyl-tRNA--protein transferase
MGFRVQAIRPDDPPDTFPEPAIMGTALGHPDGLIAIGGDLSAERLICAYQRGIFPWFNEDQPILWWCPNPRAIIEPEHFHMSRSLARRLRRAGWRCTINRSFTEVIDNCASGRGQFGTWITPEMKTAYRHLHELGFAHSIESWFRGELAGGIYGVRLGNVFFGESMYTGITDGSKVALSGLVHLCLENGIALLDCQVSSPHLTTLGMKEIPRNEFLQRLGHPEKTPLPLEPAAPMWISGEELAACFRP